MQIETILSGVASIIAIAISGWSLYISRRAASIANGQLELQMRDSISQAKRYIDEATRSLE